MTSDESARASDAGAHYVIRPVLDFRGASSPPIASTAIQII